MLKQFFSDEPVGRSKQPAEFYTLTQERYTTLVQSGEEAPKALLSALHDAMAQHPVLAKVSTR